MSRIKSKCHKLNEDLGIKLDTISRKKINVLKFDFILDVEINKKTFSHFVHSPIRAHSHSHTDGREQLGLQHQCLARTKPPTLYLEDDLLHLLSHSRTTTFV